MLLPPSSRYGVSVLRCFCVIAAVLGPEPPMWLQRRLRRDAALRRLHAALSHSFLNAKELFLVAGIYVLAWAVLGVLVFGGDASESAASATSFSSLPAALYTSFAWLTGANSWHRGMWHQMEAADTPAVLFGIVQQLGAVFVMATLKGAFVRSYAVKEDTVRAARRTRMPRIATDVCILSRNSRTSKCSTALLRCTRPTLRCPLLCVLRVVFRCLCSADMCVWSGCNG